jgi:hypothetical protein
MFLYEEKGNEFYSNRISLENHALCFTPLSIYQQLMHTFLQANHFLPPTRFGVFLRYLQEILDCFCTILYKKIVILESINANFILMCCKKKTAKKSLKMGQTTPEVKSD